MTAPADKPRTTPEPGQPAADGNLGGMLSTADRGVADALQRSSERGDDSATGPAGPAAAEGRAQGAHGAQPGSSASSGATAGRTPTPAGDATPPRDEGPLESFGRAISEVVTGTVDDRVAPLTPIAPNTPDTSNTPKTPKTPGTRR